MLEIRGLTSAEVGTAAARLGIVLHELIPQTASLEQAFMRLTGGAVEYHAEIFGHPKVDETVKEAA